MKGLRFTLFVALRHIRMRVRSTLLILLGVSLGVFVMVVMQSMMFGFQAEFMRILLTTTPSILVKGRERGTISEGRIYTSRPGTLYDQTRLKPIEKEEGIRAYRTLSREIEAIPGVQAVAPIVQGRAILRYGTRDRGANVIGVDAPDYDRVVEFRSKVIGDVDELIRRRDGVILGVFLAEELGAVPGTRIRMIGVEGQEADLRIVALFRSGITAIDKTYAFVNLPMGQSILDYPTAATGIAVKVSDPDRATPIARRVEFVTGLESQSWQEINAVFFGIMRQQNVITFGAVAMTILVAGFGVANGLVTVVLEKRRDIGILRSLGVTARGVAAIFTVEGIIIGILGAIVGVALGAVWVDIMDDLPIGGRGGLSTSDTFLMLREPAVYIRSIVFALIVSTAASLAPALRAAKYDPVEIIRTAK